MIEEVDRQVQAWVQELIADDAGVSIGPLKPKDGQPQVIVYLTDILPTAANSRSRSQPLQVTLRYLVTTWAETIEHEHRLLDRVLFAAMEHSDYEVELTPQPGEFWHAFGIPPRPAFLLTLPVRLERLETMMGRVLKPAEVRLSATAPLTGQILGPGNTPICEAQVELPSLRVRADTDRRGCFRFPAVPTEPQKKALYIRAKGHERRIEVSHGDGHVHPLVIHFDIPEV